MLFVAGWLRLGFLADLISTPVLAGFKLGMGILIATMQLGPLFGIDAGGTGFASRIATALAHAADASGPTVVPGVGCLVALLFLARLAPRVPAPLVVLAGAVLATTSLGLEARGVATVPPIPEGLPSMGWPDPALGAVLLPSARGVALMALVEPTAAARVYEAPDDPPLDADQELRALGLASLAAGLLHAIRRIGYVRGRDGALAVIAVAGVLALGVLPGVLVAVLASFVALMASGQQLPVRVLGRKPGTPDFRDFASHPGDEQVSGLLVLRPEGGLFFGNARRVQRLVLDAVAHAARPVRASTARSPSAASRSASARSRRGRSRWSGVRGSLRSSRVGCIARCRRRSRPTSSRLTRRRAERARGRAAARSPRRCGA